MRRTPRGYGRRIVCKLVATACVIVGCAWLAGAATWSNLNATATVGSNTFSAASNYGAPGAPTAATTTPGDGQVAVSWTAPSSAGGSAISGYTATASPSGQTCSTTGGTSCMITGLTDGSTQSITVTAANVSGSGAASTAVSATPYPASLFASANGFSLWLDGADASTLFSGSGCSGAVSNGGSIGCWTDKSGTGENFTQATSGSQPVLGTLNGLSAINFTSTGQLLNSINSSDTYQTVFVVAQPQTTPSGWDYLFGHANTDFSIRQYYGSPASATTQFSSPVKNDWAYTTGPPALDWTDGQQATGPALGATSIISDQASSAQSYSTSVSTSFTSAGYTRGIVGDVGEVIAFSGTLTTAQRRVVEDYLARKWGTTITPDPPGTPTVTAANASVSVSWAASAYNGGSSVSGYTVTASGGQTCTTSGATSCTVTGLTNGTSYTFAVTATNSVGAGSSSANSAAVTPVGVPTAPTGLAATATTTTLAVSWTAPSSNGGAAISSYTASVTPGGASCTNASTSCTISGLTPGTAYTVTVTASNSAGAGPASSPLSASTSTPPGAPTGVALTAGDGQIAVRWTAPSASGSGSISGYTATASPSGQTCTTTSATSCTITGLTDGSTQSITVTASNSYGTGQASGAVSTTPYPAALFTSANGFSLWLDGADPSTLFSGSGCSGAVSSGGSIGCWKDKSGVAENFTQPTSGSQPVLATLNGLGAIDFTSVSQLLTSINSSDNYQTVFLVAQPQTTASGYDYMFGHNGSDFNIRETPPNNALSSPNAQDWAGSTGTPALDWTNGRQATDLTLGATTVITAQSSVQESFTASVSSSVTSQGNTRGMLGDVGEVIAFSGTLTTAQRRTVEDYLARKWGPTITPDPPGTPNAGTAGNGAASVSWAAPAYNGGSTVSGYTVTSSPGSKTCTTSSATNCVVGGLSSGTSYTFTVTAANSVGTGSASPASSAVNPH